MSDLTRVDVDRITRLYLLANTPGFLFKNLRSDPFILDTARHKSTNELVEFVRSIEGNNDRSDRQTALAYAALVACTFKEPDAVRDAFPDPAASPLRWIGPILKLWWDSSIITQIVELPYRATRARIQSSQKASSNVTEVKIEPR